MLFIESEDTIKCCPQHSFAMLGDPHLAQDAAQEAFLDAYQNLSKLQEPAAFPGWFRRIVVENGFGASPLAFGFDRFETNPLILLIRALHLMAEGVSINEGECAHSSSQKRPGGFTSWAVCLASSGKILYPPNFGRTSWQKSIIIAVEIMLKYHPISYINPSFPSNIHENRQNLPISDSFDSCYNLNCLW